MRRRVYLMRHAEVAYFADPARPVAATDVALTDAGLEQARAAGRALAGVRLDRVITSGLPRTVQTADLVVERLERPPAEPDYEAWPDLEELRGGDQAAIADEGLEEAFLGAFSAGATLETTFLGGESVGSLVERVDAALTRLYADDGWDTVLLVLHGGVNRAVLSWVLAGPGAFFGQIEQAPGCVNVVDGEPGRFVLRAVNLAPYDPVHLDTRTTTLEDMLEQCREFRRRGSERAAFER